MDATFEMAQQQDEQQAFLVCLKLYQLAQRGEKFSDDDLKDLQYFLGLPKERT